MRGILIMKTLLLINLLVFALPEVGAAGPLHSIFGRGKPEYHRHINKKFLEYYEKKHFNFSQHLSPVERDYLRGCVEQIDSWARHLPDGGTKDQDQLYPLSPLRIAVTLKDKKIKFGKLAIACPLGNTTDFDKFLAVLKKNSIQPPVQVTFKNYFWFEWDFDQKWQSLYYFEKNQLVRETYEQGKKIETVTFHAVDIKKLRQEHSLIASLIHSGLQSSDTPSTTWLELSSFDSRLVDESVRLILYNILNETGFMADSIELVDPKNAVFFYP